VPSCAPPDPVHALHGAGARGDGVPAWPARHLTPDTTVTATPPVGCANARPWFFAARTAPLRTRIARIVARSTAWLIVPIALGPPVPIAAQEQGAHPAAPIDIPAQPLDGALTRFFELTGVQLLYDSQLTAGRRSSTVRGNYPPQTALTLLLRGTGLIARYSGAGAAVITTPDRDATIAQVPLGRVVIREKVAAQRVTPLDRMAYYGRLESALQAALRADARTQPLRFTVRLAIRLSDVGKVGELRFARGSGDRRTDQAIGRVLQDRAVPAPPQGMAQPLLVELRGQSR